MHTLTVCQRGNVRSVALSSILKDEFDQKDVIAIGTETTTPATWDILGRWADRIIVCAELDIANKVPEKFWGKMIHLNVGRDIWHNPADPTLRDKIKDKMRELDNNVAF